MVAADKAAVRILGVKAQGVPEQAELLLGGFDHGFLHASAALAWEALSLSRGRRWRAAPSDMLRRLPAKESGDAFARKASSVPAVV